MHLSPVAKCEPQGVGFLRSWRGLSRTEKWVVCLLAAHPITGSFMGWCVVTHLLPLAQGPPWGARPGFVPPSYHPGPVSLTSQRKQSLLTASTLSYKRASGRATGLSHSPQTPPSRHRGTFSNTPWTLRTAVKSSH